MPLRIARNLRTLFSLDLCALVPLQDGLLSVLFDNRHSTFRAKNVEYRIDVVAPEGDDVPLPTAEEIDAAPTANGGSAAPALPVAAQ